MSMRRDEYRVGSNRPAYGALGMTSRIEIETDGIRVRDEADVERVLLGRLAEEGKNNYGLKVVGPDGATVIIDGTSNMFKILASGTLQNTKADGAEGFVETSLPGLGTFSATPMQLSSLAQGPLTTDNRFGNPMQVGYGQKMYVAASSGGAVDNGVVAITTWAEAFTSLTAGGVCEVALFHRHYDNGEGNRTVYAKWYVLREAAM
jgi:hypothetical protein